VEINCNIFKRNRHSPMNLLASGFLCMALGFYALGCAQADLTLPNNNEVSGIFAASPSVTASVNGNVVEVVVDQPLYQIRRGGTLWAKVGPYVYLFTTETESIFQQFPGVAGVRVITRTSRSNSEVARAFLHRDKLNTITWQRALNIAGKARRDGSNRPVFLEDLVTWGESHTDYGYSDEFAS
jgi:hypothetical protein